jgi:hypothetical protein
MIHRSYNNKSDPVIPTKIICAFLSYSVYTIIVRITPFSYTCVFKVACSLQVSYENFMDFLSVLLALQTLILPDMISLIIFGVGTYYETQNILILLPDPLFLS